MGEGRLTKAWLWKPTPGLLWRASCFDPREIFDAPTKEEAKAGLEQTLGPRAMGLLHWIDGPEPGPRRPGGPVSDAPAVENLTEKERDERVGEVFRKWAKVFHPDVAGSVKPHDAMLAITELYEAATCRPVS
jgi:hypothetical protein